MPVLSAKEPYANESVVIFGSKTDPAVKLSRGSHKFAFSFPLGPSWPSSTQGWNFSIKYKLKLQWIGLELQSSVRMFWTPKPKVEFKVIRHEDLNDWDLLNDPVEEEKFYPLAMKVNLLKTGFTPGENISVFITNKSSKDFKPEVKLKEVIVLRYNRNGDYDQYQPSVIATATSEDVTRRDPKELAFSLTVPNDVSSSSTVPSKIMLRYEVEVTAQTDDVNKLQSINIPITIGSVALRQAGA